jgi:hypothetical protein
MTLEELLRNHHDHHYRRVNHSFSRLSSLANTDAHQSTGNNSVVHDATALIMTNEARRLQHLCLVTLLDQALQIIDSFESDLTDATLMPSSNCSSQ